MIPKIIHYCWLSNDPIPLELQNYMETWKEKLSDYEFIKWDFSRFDKLSSQWVCEAFDNKKYAFAADYIRLYAIYTMGGIYLDMDIEVLKSFNDLLNSEYMMAYERTSDFSIEAGCFGAEKGALFIENLLKTYENKHFVKEDGSFDMLPLPKIMARVMEQQHYNIKIMDWHTFTNKSYETGEESPIDRSYAIHHFAGSWKTEEEKYWINLSRELTNKYGVIGNITFKIRKYVLHPKNILEKLK